MSSKVELENKFITNFKKMTEFELKQLLRFIDLEGKDILNYERTVKISNRLRVLSND